MIRNKLMSLVVFCAAASLAQAQQFPSTTPIVPFPVDSKAVQGEPDFEKVFRFSQQSQIRQLGQGVAHLILSRTSVCSGFLVARDVLMTNEHCVVESGRARQPSEIEVFMDYYEDGRKGSRSALGQEYLYIDEPLDFALVRLDRPLGDSYPVLELSSSIPRESGSVKVIQHPEGRSKEVSRRNAQILEVYSQDNVIHYLADTQGGSSGSPVFALDGETVIALHHVGTRGFNEGVLMSSILEKVDAIGGASSAPPRWQQLERMVENGERLPVAANSKTYALGQPMVLALDVPRSGFLHIMTISEQDEMTLLFPNQYHTDSRVSAGRMSFPTDAMPFELTASEPIGRQLVVALLTDESLDLYEESGVAGRAVFAPLSNRSMGSMSRFTARSGEYYWAGKIETAIVR